MGLFGRKKLKFVQTGLMQSMVCSCGYAGLMTGYYDDDIPGYPHDGLLRCWDCGSVYTDYPEGKFVTTVYAGPERVTWEAWRAKHRGDG